MKIRSVAIFLAVNAFWIAVLSLAFRTGSFSNESKVVYTTRTGECYHLSGCSSLSRSKYQTTLLDAVEDGYYSCSNCDPPALRRGKGFQYSVIHYILIVPVSALFSHIGTQEILWLDPKHPVLLYILHVCISAGLSALFDFLF